MRGRGNRFDFTKVSETNLPVALQHGEELFLIGFVIDVEKVNHVAPILWRLSCFELAVN